VFERERLHRFVQPIAETTTGETVDSANSRNTIGSGGGASDHISTITVSVYDARSQACAERTELAIFF
jgi:hypothetical protein